MWKQGKKMEINEGLQLRKAEKARRGDEKRMTFAKGDATHKYRQT